MSLNSNQIYSAPSQLYSTDYVFTSTYSGAFSGTITVRLTKRNGITYLSFDQIIGTANNTTTNINVADPIPAIFRPSGDKFYSIACLNNTSSIVNCLFQVLSNGTLAFTAGVNLNGAVNIRPASITYRN